MTEHDERNLELAQMQNELADAQSRVDSIKQRIADVETVQQAERARLLLRRLADSDKTVSILDAVIRCWCSTHTKTMPVFLDSLEKAIER